MSDDIKDLLDFGSIDVFYVVWQVHGKTYYLSDMTSDLQHINWTKNRRTAFYLYTEKEARKHANLIKKTRKGVGVATGEIDVIDDRLDVSV